MPNEGTKSKTKAEGKGGGNTKKWQQNTTTRGGKNPDPRGQNTNVKLTTPAFPDSRPRT